MIFATYATMELPSLSKGDHEPKSQNCKRAHDAYLSEPDTMPIAIVGMACRFPGEAANVNGLWDMCRGGRSAWSEIPQSRMNAEAFWHPDPSKTGSVCDSISALLFEYIYMRNQFNARGAHFIQEDISLFDAPFFNISPYEAKVIEPIPYTAKLANLMEGNGSATADSTGGYLRSTRE